MIKDIKELNFPAYATLETATAAISDMGDRTITSQVKIDGDVVPDFSYDWEVEFKGERYIHPVKTPQGTKDNTSRKSKIDLVFQHWAIYEMKRQYFVEMASTTAGTAIADKYIASLGLNLEDFVTAFNLVLNHYFGGRIIINLNPNPLQLYSKEAKFVSISYSYIWDVLQQMHEIYGVRWTLKTDADGVCEILMGYPAEEVSHIFEYGFEGGLLSVQRQVQSTEIRNRLLGRGGSKNLPHRYFKDKDPNNPLFEADPDWIPELANIAFTELRGKTFRDYVRGWKARRYGGTPMAEPTEAYLAGYNAEKFDPIEYVEDKDSIAKYGVLIGALENNEEIYPSIQGAPGEVDMIVDAEQVTDDDVDAAVENDSVVENIGGAHYTQSNAEPQKEISIDIYSQHAGIYFIIPNGKTGTIYRPSFNASGSYLTNRGGSVTFVDKGKITVVNNKCQFSIHKKGTGEEVSTTNIPPGEYYYKAKVVVSHLETRNINITASVSGIRLNFSAIESNIWNSSFDVWIRNIWNSSRNAGETDQQYADRVWLPILGDRMGDEARVVFASGWLSFSSNWEFPIVGYAFDDSKPDSHWRLTLAKSEAELEASGKYIPYEGYNASAGDRFFFIGIDMPWQYVYWGEERIDDYKRDTLPEIAWINPSWVIKTDKVRLNQNREGAKLIDSLSVGAQIRLASKQFISGAYESLYVQSMTYSWTADTILYPDVEVVISDKVAAVKNPVAQMQGSIETLQRQVGSLSNIQQIIRQVCDQLYLRKDGIEDISKSPTKFLGKVTGEKFRQGQIGGRDWGIYRDENGNAIFEADKIVARQGILVNDLVVNEATYVGGLQINSAAAMKVAAVEDTETGYVCYFDQQHGSVINKFKVDDVILCQKFDPEDNEVKFYKRRIVAIAETSVTLSKTDVSGDGIPAVDDEIIHYGSYTDKTRQFVIIRDVIGGGYERMLMGLDSVTSEGFEYYFAGKSADSKARWFVGDLEQYVKYENGQLTIKGNLFVLGSDEPITDQIAELDYIKYAFGDGTQGLILGTAIIVGYNDDQGNFVPMAGMSGVFDKDSENGGPAAWYGGTTENAKSMIFMDGSGFLASKNIRWNARGEVEFGTGVKISGSPTQPNATLGSIIESLSTLASYWKVDSSGNLYSDYNVYSTKQIAVGAAGEPGESGGGTGGGSNVLLLSSWNNLPEDLSGYALGATLGVELDERVQSLERGSGFSIVQTGSGNVITSISQSGKNILIGKALSVGYIGTLSSLAVSDIPDLSSKYMPLSGGTMAEGAGLYNSSDTARSDGAVGFNRDHNAFGSRYFPTYIRSSVDPKVRMLSGDYTIIHSGNIGSQSVNYASTAGNASTLGGVSTTGFYRSALQEIPSGDLAALNAGSYYTATNKGDTNPLPTTYCSLSVLGTSYYSQQLCVSSDATRAWLRGIIRSSSGVSAKDWHELAFVDSNVASATKLATARTIWGQSFDGTGNVDGDILINNGKYVRAYASDGTLEGILGINASNSLLIGYGHAKTGRTQIYGNEIGLYTSETQRILVTSEGNIGIDTLSPTEKLHVIGNIKASVTSYANTFAFNTGSSKVTTTASYLTFLSQGNEMCVWYGGSNESLYINYRAASTGRVPVTYIWNRGSSTTYARHMASRFHARDEIVVTAGGNSITAGGNEGTAGVFLKGEGSIDITATTPHIDFHYNHSTSDYDVRLINNNTSVLSIIGCFLPYSNNVYALGSDTNRWSNIHTNKLQIGSITLTDENGTLKIDGNAYTTGQNAAGAAGSPVSNNVGNEYNLSDINATSGMISVTNGTVVKCSANATLNFSNLYASEYNKPCVIYLIKTSSCTLTVTGNGVYLINSSGDLSSSGTVPNYSGLMCVYDWTNNRWIGHII